MGLPLAWNSAVGRLVGWLGGWSGAEHDGCQACWLRGRVALWTASWEVIHVVSRSLFIAVGAPNRGP
eukprot:10455058-Alexandrium_andersonii.AAC.1